MTVLGDIFDPLLPDHLTYSDLELADRRQRQHRVLPVALCSLVLQAQVGQAGVGDAPSGYRLRRTCLPIPSFSAILLPHDPQPTGLHRRGHRRLDEPPGRGRARGSLCGPIASRIERRSSTPSPPAAPAASQVPPHETKFPVSEGRAAGQRAPRLRPRQGDPGDAGAPREVPRLKGTYALGDSFAIVPADACIERGRKDVAIAGMGDSDEAVEAMKEGEITGTSFQEPEPGS